MNIHQRLNQLEAKMHESQQQGFFADNARLIVSVVNEQGKDIHGYMQTFTKPYGSTKQHLTLEQLTQVKAAL